MHPKKPLWPHRVKARWLSKAWEFPGADALEELNLRD